MQLPKIPKEKKNSSRFFSSLGHIILATSHVHDMYTLALMTRLVSDSRHGFRGNEYRRRRYLPQNKKKKQCFRSDELHKPRVPKHQGYHPRASVLLNRFIQGINWTRGRNCTCFPRGRRPRVLADSIIMLNAMHPKNDRKRYRVG